MFKNLKLRWFALGWLIIIIAVIAYISHYFAVNRLPALFKHSFLIGSGAFVFIMLAGGIFIGTLIGHYIKSFKKKSGRDK